MEVDRIFHKVHAKNLEKVAIIGEVMGRERPSILRKLSFKFHHYNNFVEAHCLNYANIIINMIINMDDIKQERPNKGPILKLNKRLEKTSLNKKFDTHIKEFMVFQTLKK